MAKHFALKFSLKSLQFKFRLLFAVLLLLVAILMRMAIAPISIDPVLPYVQKHLKIGDFGFQMQSLSLSFDGSVRLHGTGAVLISPDGLPRMSVSSVKVALSNRYLIQGQLVVKHVVLNGSNIELKLTPTGISAAGIDFRRAKGDKIGLIGFLNQPHHSPHFAQLRAVEIVNTKVFVDDQFNNRAWQLSNVEGMLTKDVDTGESLAITGQIADVDNSAAVSNLDFTIEHNKGDNLAHLHGAIEHASMNQLKGYLPQEVLQIFNGSGKLAIRASLGENNAIIAPHIMASLQNVSANLEGVYSNPLQFPNLDLSVVIEENGRRLVFDAIDLVDVNGVKAGATGIVAINDAGEANLDIKLNIAQMPLQQIIPYLPDAVLADTVDWLNNNITAGQAMRAEVGFKGAAESIVECKPSCGLFASFMFDDAVVKVTDNLTPFTKLSGDFVMQGSEIAININSGKLKDEQISDVTVKLSDLWENAAGAALTANGRAEGNIASAVKVLQQMVPQLAELPVISGKHVSEVTVKLPLAGENIDDKVHYQVQSKFSNVATKYVWQERELNFNSEDLGLISSNNSLTLRGNVIVNNAEGFRVFWSEEGAGKKLIKRGEFNGNLSSQYIMPLLQDLGVEASGTTAVNIAIEQPYNQPLSYELKADLAEIDITSVQALKWFKPKHNNTKLFASGQIDNSKNTVSADVFEVRGNDLEIIGSFFHNIDNPAENIVTLSPFTIARNNATITWEKDKIRISGESFDLSGKPVWESQMVPFADGKIEMDVENLHLSGGTMYDVSTTLNYANDKLNNIAMVATVGSNRKDFQLVLDEANAPNRGLHIYAADAGETLKAADLYNEMQNGELSVEILFNTPNDLSMWNGDIGIKNAQITNAPILTKILSLLSLQELFSGKEGISFDFIHLPLSFTGHTLTINEGNLKGPSMIIRLNGDINTDNNTVKLKGGLMPMAGVNKLVGEIPLLGAVLTGSQKGLVVADFSLKGDIKKPDVFVNPLSVVTPGIVKDLFRFVIDGGNGDNKPANPNPVRE